MKEKLINLIKFLGKETAWKNFYQNLFSGYDEDYYAGDNLLCIKEELEKNGFFVKSEDHYGGEGKGDTYWSVFSVTHNNNISYFRIDGWYQSHYGREIRGDHFDFDEVEKIPAYQWSKKNE